MDTHSYSPYQVFEHMRSAKVGDELVLITDWGVRDLRVHETGEWRQLIDEKRLTLTVSEIETDRNGLTHLVYFQLFEQEFYVAVPCSEIVAQSAGTSWLVPQPSMRELHADHTIKLRFQSPLHGNAFYVLPLDADGDAWLSLLGAREAARQQWEIHLNMLDAPSTWNIYYTLLASDSQACFGKFSPLRMVRDLWRAGRLARRGKQATYTRLDEARQDRARHAA
jgi:hypothetical protein